MDPKDLRILKIFEKIEDDQPPSQRALAKELGISLGLVNSFIKRLVNKGYFKVANIPKNRVRYLLTPKGLAEKTRLTYLYLQYSYEFYKDARKKLGNLFRRLETEGVKLVVFYGVSDFAEIAYISLLESSIKFVGIVDISETGKKKFMGHRIKPPELLETLGFDKIIITVSNPKSSAKYYIKKRGIHTDKILQPDWT